jgi:hypothetical protein
MYYAEEGNWERLQYTQKLVGFDYSRHWNEDLNSL